MSAQGFEDLQVVIPRAQLQAASWMQLGGMSNDEIRGWAELGNLNEVAPLINSNFPLEVMRKFPRHPDLIKAVVRVLPKARTAGMFVEDLPYWEAGEVLRLHGAGTGIDARAWARWRRLSLDTVGHQQAAWACAAGIQISEVRALVTSRRWDPESVQIMAALALSRR